MNADEELNLLTEKIIGLAFKVGGYLGSIFVEKCYENALVYELRKARLKVQQQVALSVWYEEIIVGEFLADIIVEGCVLVELKAMNGLKTVHTAQCINYLAATKLPICLLINFGKRVDIKRLVGPSFNKK